MQDFTPEWYERQRVRDRERYQNPERRAYLIKAACQQYWSQFSPAELRARTKRRSLRAFLLARAAERRARS